MKMYNIQFTERELQALATLTETMATPRPDDVRDAYDTIRERLDHSEEYSVEVSSS